MFNIHLVVCHGSGSHVAYAIITVQFRESVEIVFDVQIIILE